MTVSKFLRLENKREMLEKFVISHTPKESRRREKWDFSDIYYIKIFGYINEGDPRLVISDLLKLRNKNIKKLVIKS